MLRAVQTSTSNISRAALRGVPSLQATCTIHVSGFSTVCSHHGIEHTLTKECHHEHTHTDATIVSSFTTAMPSEVTHKAPKQPKKTKSSSKVKKADISRPQIGSVPTPFLIRHAEKEVERDQQKYHDADVPLVSEAAERSIVLTPLMSQLYVPKTVPEIPEGASLSLKLFLEAGYIRELTPGSYTLLPLGYRVMRKIQAIVEEEFVKANCQPVDLPNLIPGAFMEETGRWESLQSELLTLTDKAGKALALSPSHEEAFANLAKATISSYKDMPIRVTQFSRKYRDEVDPAAGLLRSREFMTQDGFAFHTSADGAHETYKEMLDVFKRVFERLDISVVQVEADPGTTGGNLSHEYHVITADGDATVLQCELCGYSANQERASFQVPPTFDQAAHNNRLRNGPIPVSIVNDPRSVGLFPSAEELERERALSPEAREKQKKLDMGIRSTLSAVMKQLVPDLARKDVPMVANLVRLKYCAPDVKHDAFEGIPEAEQQFKNLVLIMFRADRELSVRAICNYFECENADVVPPSSAALLLLKYHKFKVQQHTALKNAGKLPQNHNNPFERRATQHHKLDLQKMVDLEAANDREGLIKEQRRVERLNARMNVDGGMMVMVDESLIADGMDLDTTALEDYNPSLMNEVNKDRARGHNTLVGGPNTSLLDAIKNNGMSLEDNDDIEALEAKLAEAGKSLTDLEEELGIADSRPMIMSNTEWTPQLAKAMGADPDDSDDDMLSSLKSLTTANPVQGEFVSGQDGDKCVQKACQGQGVLSARKSIEVGQLFFLSDRYSSLSKTQYTAEDGVKEYVEMCGFTMGVSRLMAAALEAPNGHDHMGMVWQEPIAPYLLCVTAQGDVDAPPLKKRGQLTGFARDRVRVEQEREFLRKKNSEAKDRAGYTGEDADAKSKLLKHLLAETEDQEKMLGLWDWGDAPTRAHVENIATLLGDAVPLLRRDVIIDDRYDMSPEQRLENIARMGIPYVVVVGDKFQSDGLLELRHRRTNTMELVSLDRLVAIFAGTVPMDERPEFNKADYERSLQFKVDDAIMRKYGMESSHKGDPNYFKIDTSSELQYDYNRDVDEPFVDDYTTTEDLRQQMSGNAMDDSDEMQKHLTEMDRDRNLRGNNAAPTPTKKEIEEAEQDLNKTEASMETEDSLAADLKQVTNSSESRSHRRGMRVGKDYYDMSAFEDIAPGKKKSEVEQRNMEKDKYPDEWLRIINQMRGPGYPSPTFDELHAFYKVGILHEPKPGVVRVNEALALANLHLVRGGMTLKYEYVGGVNEAMGAQMNLKKELVRQLPESKEESIRVSRRLLEEALKQPLNPPLRPVEVRRMKYELYGIIDGDAEDMNLFEEDAAEQPQQQQNEQQYVADVAAQVMSGAPASRQAPPATPARPRAPTVKPKFSLTSVNTKYVSRLERAQTQLASELSSAGATTNEQHTGMKHAVKYRNLDGTVYYEDSSGALKEEDVFVNTSEKAIDTSRNVWQPLKKGRLSSIMNTYKEQIEKYGDPDAQQ